MLTDLFANHGSVIFLSILLLLVLSGLISSRKKARKERPDPPFIFAHIREMYICYQCDTIFNTARCPECNEEGIIPLIHLTGSIIEDERVAAVIGKMQGRSTWKLPIFHTFQNGQAVASASRPEVSNGAASEVPVTIGLLPSARGSDLS
jgi:predicted transcriptional regulator